MSWLRIGELAKRCEIPTGRVRYYERMGLIPEPERTESNYRLYPLETADRISLIQRMKGLGFTLIDRIRFGYVINFISFRWWPAIFNIADMEIRTGASMLLFFYLTRKIQWTAL
jgi:hypothetical protein